MTETGKIENYPIDDLRKLYFSILQVGYSLAFDELEVIRDKVNQILGNEQAKQKQAPQAKQVKARVTILVKIEQLVKKLLSTYNKSDKQKALVLKTLARDRLMQASTPAPVPATPPPPAPAPATATAPKKRRRS